MTRPVGTPESCPLMAEISSALHALPAARRPRRITLLEPEWRQLVGELLLGRSDDLPDRITSVRVVGVEVEPLKPEWSVIA